MAQNGFAAAPGHSGLAEGRARFQSARIPMKTDPRIDTYIAQAAPFAPPILRHLRQLVHRGCPGVEEDIKRRAPSFVLNGKILCFTAAFKAHVVFGFWHKEASRLIAKERGTADGAYGVMGRLTSLADLPDDRTMLRYIKTAAQLTVSGVPARAEPKPKKPLRVPAELAAALKKNKKAAANFAGFSPSCRREYIEWITEAKRPETRTARIATTIEWTAQGKPRNWKYVNC